MKKMLVLLLSLLVASSALAVIDGDDNMMGFYFDETADANCITGVAPYAQIPVYVIMTNPSVDAIGGFEFGYDLIGDATVLSTTLPANNIDVGYPGNHIVGLGSPLNTTEATIVATLNLMYMSTTSAPVSFTLHGSNPSSINPELPTILLGDGSLMTLGTSTLPGTMTAMVNGVCEDVVDTEDTNFGNLKSLYR